MTTVVFFELDDETEIEIAKSDVYSCEDVAELQVWDDRLTEICDELGCLSQANKENGYQDRALSHKYGLHKIAQNWVRKRLQQMGHEGGSRSEKEINQAREIARLLRENDRLRQMLSENGLALAA